MTGSQEKGIPGTTEVEAAGTIGGGKPVRKRAPRRFAAAAELA
jgi:hypothetical protein